MVSALSNEFQPTVIVLSQPKAVKVFPLFARRHFNPVLVNFFDLFICKQFAYLLMVSVWLNMPNTRSHITMPSDNFLKCYQMPFFSRRNSWAWLAVFFSHLSFVCDIFLSIKEYEANKMKLSAERALGDLGNHRHLTPWLVEQKTFVAASASQVYLLKCEKMKWIFLPHRMLWKIRGPNM